MSAIKLPSDLRYLSTWEMSEIRAACRSWACTRRGSRFNADGTILDYGECVGYHCSACGEPCGMMGHECERSRLIQEALQRGETA